MHKFPTPQGLKSRLHAGFLTSLLEFCQLSPEMNTCTLYLGQETGSADYIQILYNLY